MAEVALEVGGHRYTLRCDDGEEPRLHRLAAEVDRRIANLRGAIGPAGESHLLLLAALLLSDELDDARATPASAPATPTAADDSAAAVAITTLAARVEALSTRLAALATRS